jgi:hypothetical protein
VSIGPNLHKNSSNKLLFSILQISVPYTGYIPILRVIISPTELKMQPTIHLQRQRGYLFFDLKNMKDS